jgi:ATP-binding cassette, subfamily B, bacterial
MPAHRKPAGPPEPGAAEKSQVSAGSRATTPSPEAAQAVPSRPHRDPSSTDTVLFAIPTEKAPLVEAAPTVKLRKVFSAFWPDTRTFRGRLYLSLAMVAIPPLLAAASIWMLKVLIDNVLTPRNLGLFPLVAAAFVGLTVLEGVISFVDEYLNAWVAERFVLILRSRVFDHLQTLSLTFFEERQLGDILSRLTGDIGAIESLVLSGLNQALTYLFQIIFFAGALFFLDWRLALAAFVATPGFLLLARFFSTRIKSASRERRRRSGSITAVAEESLHNIALVQAYNQQRRESERFHRENLGSFTAQMLATKLEAMFAPFTDLLQTVGVLLVVGYGIRELIAGRITLGGLLVFLGYLSQLYGPISGVGNLVNSIYSASAGAERIFEVLDAKPEVVDPSDPVPMRRVRGALKVDRLGFSYPQSGRPTLAEISFSAAPGETIAVVGASGAGKSTLMRLLLRLHDPFRGSVSLDGVDIRQMDMADLRRNIAVVLQETLVFDGTVAENIQWGQPDATHAEVVAAAKAADAHQFINGLPGGYSTRIGQRGMMLSGGQRQRIALARAIIRDAPVLLLDEPTTGLDAAAAQRVLEPLRRAMGGRTTVVISHNLLTVTDADRILYLEHGRVAGYGTHDELLVRSPGYAELYRLHHPGIQLPPIRRGARPAPALPGPGAPGPGRLTSPVPSPVPAGVPAPAPSVARAPRPVPAARPAPAPRPVPAAVPAARPVPAAAQVRTSTSDAPPAAPASGIPAPGAAAPGAAVPGAPAPGRPIRRPVPSGPVPAARVPAGPRADVAAMGSPAAGSGPRPSGSTPRPAPPAPSEPAAARAADPATPRTAGPPRADTRGDGRPARTGTPARPAPRGAEPQARPLESTRQLEAIQPLPVVAPPTAEPEVVGLPPLPDEPAPTRGVHRAVPESGPARTVPESGPARAVPDSGPARAVPGSGSGRRAAEPRRPEPSRAASRTFDQPAPDPAPPTEGLWLPHGGPAAAEPTWLDPAPAGTGRSGAGADPLTGPLPDSVELEPADLDRPAGHRPNPDAAPAGSRPGPTGAGPRDADGRRTADQEGQDEPGSAKVVPIAARALPRPVAVRPRPAPIPLPRPGAIPTPRGVPATPRPDADRNREQRAWTYDDGPDEEWWGGGQVADERG